MADEPTLFSTEQYLDEQLRKIVLRRPKRSIDEAREFGGWTVDKLETLRLYLNLYRKVAGNGTYVDGFAGVGTIRSGGKRQPGSAAVALKSRAFKSWRLYEQPEEAAALNAWADDSATKIQRPRITIVPGDFNATILVDLESEVIPRDRPCFAFLDPDSTQLDWATVAALARYNEDCSPPSTCRVELWILLNTWQALMRLMPRNGKKPAAATLDRCLGGPDGWRDLYEADKGPESFAQRYADRLMREFGYGLARPMAIRDPKTGRPQYHMIHASDHPAAHDFMRWAHKNAAPPDSEAIPFKFPNAQPHS
ncbi:MAG: three-Cys-motif partner protein TcmP [Acidimicrobiales bacterium]|jgi:three-Cys-motif partner protein